jgi:hypothetical protein
MNQGDDKPKYRPVPPVSGQWKPGVSGNPAGRPKSKPFKMALQELIDNNPQALGVAAAALMARAHTGDVAAIQRVQDTLDGKIPQVTSIGGSEDLPAIRAITWLDALVPPPEEPHLVEGPVLEGSTAQQNDDGTREPDLSVSPELTPKD